METPYEILAVEPEADDEAIKKAYLARVRECPPDHQGEAFQRIREAYELIATDKARRQHRLFHHVPPDLGPLLAGLAATGQPQRPDAATLLAALAECVTLMPTRSGGPR